MKKIKKIIAVLVALCLFTSLVSFAKADEETADVTQTQEFLKLKAFGIVNEADELFYYTSVSRGLFVNYAMKLKGGEEMYADVKGIFADVTEATIGAKAIEQAALEGIISGKTADRFNPDDNITKNEAAKILITILGFGDIADRSGGYPNGYVALAGRFNLFKGCKSSSQDYISVADFLTILLNTLETEIPQIESMAKGENSFSAEYVVEEGNTLLSTVFDIHKSEGIVETNEYTSVNGLSTLDKNVVTIGGNNYNVGETQAAELLGYNTEFYYKPDVSEAKNLVFISTYLNDVIEVNSENIEPGGVTTTNFRYRENESDKKAKDVKISKSATMIYNGGQKKITATDLCPENGSVVLIDNNRDKTFDVVRVTNYRSIIVSGVSKSTYTVSDLLGGANIILDPEDESYNVVIYKNGEKADFSEIGLRDVISYAESSGNNVNLKYLIISSDSVQGSINAIVDDCVEIDEVLYHVDSAVMENLRLGEYASYYLDYKGRIVGKKATNDTVYGYLNDIDSESFKKIARAQIFTENNRWVILEFSEKVKFDGEKKNALELYGILKDMGNFRQLIRYTVDSSGKINMIDTAESFEEYSAAEESAIEQDVFRVYPEISSARYRSPSKSFGNTVRLDDNTKIFIIPDQTEGPADEEEFSVMPRSALYADDTYEHITPYDMDRTKLAKVVVMIGYEMPVSEESAFLIVEDMVGMPNSEGIWTRAVRGYYKGEPITLPAKSNSVYDSLEESLSSGDIIQVLLDEYGNITRLTLRHNASAGANQKFIINDLYSSATFIAGEVYYSDVEQQAFIAEGPDSKVVLQADKNTEVMLYDTENETITIGTLADLEKGNSFVARVSHYVADEIVVYH